MNSSNMSVKEIEALEEYRGYRLVRRINSVALYNKYGTYITEIGFDERVDVYKAKLIFISTIDVRVVAA
jgi:hypothetical protein